MQVLIEEIIIKDRVRTEIGDLKPLMTSMRLHGQLNPITLSRENELIAGHRRTLAARELGWKFIEAHVVERVTAAEKLQLELEENVHRKDFSPEELLAGYRRLDTYLHPSLGQRIGGAFRSLFRKIFRRKRKPTPETTTAGEAPATALPPKTNDTQNTHTAERVDSKQGKDPDVIGSQFGV